MCNNLHGPAPFRRLTGTNAMRFSTVALCLAALVSSPAADAALVNEGEYTLDTSTGVEWLNPVVTSGLSYDQILAGAGGWMAAGWQLATVNQFDALAQAYIGPQNLPYDTVRQAHEASSASYLASALSVVNTFGPTIEIQEWNSVVGFQGTDLNVSGFLAGDYYGELNYFPVVSYAAGSWISAVLQPGTYSIATAQFGAFFVMDPVGYVQPGSLPELPPVLEPTTTPETSTWAMMLLGFAGLGFAGYRRSRKAVSVAA
jgi:hypothetical protein